MNLRLASDASAAIILFAHVGLKSLRSVSLAREDAVASAIASAAISRLGVGVVVVIEDWSFFCLADQNLLLFLRLDAELVMRWRTLFGSVLLLRDRGRRRLGLFGFLLGLYLPNILSHHLSQELNPCAPNLLCCSFRNWRRKRA